MSKYLILIIINLPLLAIGLMGTISRYKLKRMSRRRYYLQFLFWLSIGVALISIEPIYNTLIRFNLTNSSPMSIFDMVLLTLVFFSIFLIKRANESITRLSRRISRLHESLAIAEEQRHWDKEK